MGNYADRYIRQTTRGLFGKIRHDRAAELRTHILDRTKQYMLEGFAADEAEYLAVEHMGGLPRNQLLKLPIFYTALVLLFTAILGIWYVKEPYVVGSVGNLKPIESQLSYSSHLDKIHPVYLSDLVFAEQTLNLRLPNIAKSVSFQTFNTSETQDVQTLPTSFSKTTLLHRAKFVDISYAINADSNNYDIRLKSVKQLETINAPHVTNKGGFFLDFRTYMTSKNRQSYPSLSLDVWIPIAVFNADSLNINSLEDITMLYMYVNSKSGIPETDIPSNNILDEVLLRHKALINGHDIASTHLN